MAQSQMATGVPRASHKHVLLAEILSVTATMRKNSRWAGAHYMSARDLALGSNLGLRIATPTQRSDNFNHEAELMIGFQDLKRTLREVEDIDDLPLLSLLSPFFALIRSPLSTGPITSAALTSLHNFFVCGLISPQAKDIEEGLLQLSHTISHCKFEASDSSGDEVVLLKIMAVIYDTLCGYGVDNVLGDIEVCEMLETVLTTCCQMRLSEILRKSAESTMHAIVRSVFSKLYLLDIEAEEKKLRHVEDDLAISNSKVAAAGVTSTAPTDATADSDELPLPSTSDSKLETEEQEAETKAEPELEVPQLPHNVRTEYGLPSALELLRVLINVLDPNDQQHTDSTRLIALGVLNSAFEESGPRIAEFPSLSTLILDTGCKFLFQLARSDHPTILHAALRTISTVFETMRVHLKLQQELFLAFSMDRLAPFIPPNSLPRKSALGTSSVTSSPRNSAPSSPALGPQVDVEKDDGEGANTPARVLGVPARGEMRDLLLESLGMIARHPSFMVELYINYDCDVNCENMFERLMDFCTKSVYPDQYHGTLDSRARNSQYLCLDILLAFVNDMASRMDGHGETWPSRYPSPHILLHQKSQKKRILTGAAKFNTKPKTGLVYLEENGLIYADLNEEVSKEKSLARFLKSCGRLDKKLLGDFISKPDNLDLLKAFIAEFDFRDKPVAEALRELLESFRLPGESQQINRIAETFASIYFATKPPGINNEDAIYVLTYSIIMLNVDQHSPQVRKRMTIEEYKKNLKGVNDGKDFDPEFLQEIFDSISKREIVMPEEHAGQLGFEFAWKELLARSRTAGDLLMCNSSEFDKEMFKVVWKPLISTIVHAFITFDDDYIIQRSVAGFRQCATLAGYFNLPDVFDYVVVSLSQATSLLSRDLPTKIPNYPVVNVEGQSITVSNLSVSFGTNFKGQLAAVVLFNIVNGKGNALREGWTQIFEMFQNLFLHSLLPTRMLQMEDFLGGVSMIPLQGSQPAPPPARSEGGLLSALSSYLMTPSTDSFVPRATEAEIENTLCTIDCITSCRLDELYSQITELDPEALVAAVKALETIAKQRETVKSKRDIDDPNMSLDEPLAYDPASMFLLETMVSITCQSPERIEDLWPVVFGHINLLLSSSRRYSVLLVERAVVNLFRLCLLLAPKPALRDQIYIAFDLLSGLPLDVVNSVAEQIVAGVKLLLLKHRDIVKSSTEWNLVFALVRSTFSHSEASRDAYEFIIGLAAEGPSQLVTVDNLAGLVTLLDDFVSQASIAAEQHRDRSPRQQALSAAKSPVVERGLKAIELISNLKAHITPLTEQTQIPPDKSWRQLSLPLLLSLSHQSTNAAREIRQHAIAHLQRFLLGSHSLIDDSSIFQVEDIYNRVMFPLMDDLVKPQIAHRDPMGMSETRLRASALLCKVFMRFELKDGQEEADIRVPWIQILDLLDRVMALDSNRNEQSYEAIPETLKNVVLVMNTTGILVPPPAEGDDTRNERQRTTWTVTTDRMERLLPGFLANVLQPPPPAK